MRARNVFNVLREKLTKEKQKENARNLIANQLWMKAIEIVNQVEREYGKPTHCYLNSPCEYQNESAILSSGLLTDNNGWIPCSERMPNMEEYLKDDGRFIVTDGNRVYQSIYDIYINKCFRTLQLNCLIDLGYQSEFEVDKRVIAWRPLPSPYKIIT